MERLLGRGVAVSWCACGAAARGGKKENWIPRECGGCKEFSRIWNEVLWVARGRASHWVPLCALAYCGSWGSPHDAAARRRRHHRPVGLARRQHVLLARCRSQHGGGSRHVGVRLGLQAAAVRAPIAHLVAVVGLYHDVKDTVACTHAVHGLTRTLCCV